MGEPLDCREAAARLQDYPEAGAHPRAGGGDAGPSGALPALLRLRPLRAELPRDAASTQAGRCSCPEELRARILRPAARRDGGGTDAGRPRRWRRWPPAGVALIAWRARTLTARRARSRPGRSGTAVLLRNGMAGGAVLAAFFVSSSLVGRLAPARGAEPRPQGRAARRLAGVCQRRARPRSARCSGSTIRALGLWLVTGSLAAAAADTWATVGRRPGAACCRGCLLSAARCRPGTSGGMTVVGHRWRGAGRRRCSWPATGASPPAVPRRCFRSER